ncbi:archaeosortase/exosortase family protein [bacterium]|nr:archaeosortase/exosortase family protein [candidate division CSSED10-310 bacterium]
MKRFMELYRKNAVLINFYLLFGYFCLLFYFFLHWKVTENYIAVKLPIVMAQSVALVLNLVGVDTRTIGPVVELTSFRFTIIYHCAGIFGMMIYAAAVLAYIARWWEKVYGLIFGFIGLYTINTVRMAALGIIGMKWRKHFDFYHEFLWQGIFIIFVIGFWVFWKDKMIRQPDFDDEPPDDDGGPAPGTVPAENISG